MGRIASRSIVADRVGVQCLDLNYAARVPHTVKVCLRDRVFCVGGKGGKAILKLLNPPDSSNSLFR